MVWIIRFCVFISGILYSESLCNNPLPLSVGKWKTSSRGTWTVNAAQDQISNFEVIIQTVNGIETYTMSCDDDTDADGYIVLKSTTTRTLFSGVNYVYACILFEQLSTTSTDAFKFYLGSDQTTLQVGIYERIIILPTTIPFVISTYCNARSTTPDRTHIAIKDGTEANAATDCPKSIQGTFSYDGTSCSATFLDICTTLHEVNFNYTVCTEPQMFSQGGNLYCVFSETSGGYNYLTVYNRDTTVDNSNFYQYSCLVYSTSDKVVSVSINPKQCFDSSLQTPTSTLHASGVTRTFTNYGDSECYTASSSSTNLIWLYVLIALIIIIIIIVIIILVICYLKRKKKSKQRKSDEESLQSSDSEEEQKKAEEKTKEEKKSDEQKEQRKVIPLPQEQKPKPKEDDRTSIDSGIGKERQDEKKDKNVEIKDEKQEEQRLSDENSNDLTVQNENIQEQNEQNSDENVEKIKSQDNDSVLNDDDNDKTDDENKIDDNFDNFEYIKSDERESIKNKDIDDNQDDKNVTDKDENVTDNDENVTDNDENVTDNDKNVNVIHENVTDKDENVTDNEVSDKNQRESIIERNEQQIITDGQIEQTETMNENNNLVESRETEKNEENIIIVSNKTENNNFQNDNLKRKQDNESDETEQINENIILVSDKINKNEVENNITQNKQNDKYNEPKTIEQDDKTNENIENIFSESKVKTHDEQKSIENEDERERREDKQMKVVKIYETSDLNDNLDQKKDSQQIGEKCTDQQSKIIEVKEQKEKKTTEDHEDESSDSDDSEMSSRVTTPDPEEIERNIKKIGMKKSTNYKPQGELSKVLVSREMEEKNRSNTDKSKWKAMKKMFSKKKKKITDVSKKKEENGDSRKTPDLENEEKQLEQEKIVTPFIKEYHYKKQMEQQLEDQHIWGGEPDYTERFKDSDDEDFADIFEEAKMTEKPTDTSETKVEQLQENKKRSKQSKEKDKITDNKTSKAKQAKEDQAKDSGVDSPDLKKEKIDPKISTKDVDMNDVEMTEPPPGFIKDSAGRIIRLYDNKVMTEEEMQSIFPLAKLGMLFHVPRLKRTSHGRPTGDYIQDEFGPKPETDNESVRGESREDHSKPKHPRSSKGSARKEQKEQQLQKSVAFEIDDSQSDMMIIDDDIDSERQASSSANRELLKKRLFRNKRKPRGSRRAVSEDGRPRELSDLVRVIPQSGQKYAVNGRSAIPGSVVSRSDSMKNKFDPEQQQMYREGLAADKRILERSPSLKHRPPGVPREAFVGQDTDDIRVSLENEENESRLRRNQDRFNIGSDDEFILVGDNGDQERLFTYVERPGHTSGRHSKDLFCPKHDMRHALPWSLINQYQIRESSVLDMNSVAKKHTNAPKSADNSKRDIDDKRLKELLEELYKDKKYFDHVIDTTEPNNEPIIDERDLAKHGREFLLERAEYWDDRGELPPRPPQTALGMRLSRMQTFVPDSGRVSNISYASTVTPTPRPEHMPTRNNLPQAFNTREKTIP